MSMFWEFFTFELRFRAKSVSTYVYFLLWLAFSFLCVASENFGPVANSNGKVLLNGPWGITFNDQAACLFGIIIIAAIFGTSILRDFQRDTYQILFTKPVSKFAYLGGRWAGSFATTVLVFSGLLLGAYLGTFAPWADHARIGPNHLRWYLEPFLSIVVIQIFFMGSLFFAVAALTRKIFIVYLQGVALFMAYLIGITAFSTTRSLEHFWSGILDPVGLLLNSAVSRYWSVIEKNTQLFPWDFSGILAWRIPVQPAAVGRCGRGGPACRLGVVSDVGGGADGALLGQARSARAPGRGSRPREKALVRRRAAAESSAVLWRRARHFDSISRSRCCASA